MGLVGNEKGVQRIFLPGLEKGELHRRILRKFPESQEGARVLREAKKEFIEYFSGRRVRFNIAVDFSAATSFQKRVYKAMSKIPFGQVRTYR